MKRGFRGTERVKHLLCTA